MNVDPGMKFLEEDMIQPLDLGPGEDPTIPVPPSGGIIIQGPNGCYGIKLTDGTIHWFGPNGEPIDDPWSLG